MKIILTEQQFYSLLQEGAISNVLNESINLDDLKRKIRRAIIMGVSCIALTTAVKDMNLSLDIKQQLIDMIKTEQKAQMPDSVFNEKVSAVRDYMEYALKNQGYTLESTKLKPEVLVQKSYEHNFDLPFMMAAAHLESCFGANNRAQRTNSVFSVGSYDNGKNVCTYSDPNDSVEPYIELLENDYLVNGKDTNTILNNFVNKDGKRYAKNKNYEKELKSVINRIKKMYPILES